MSQRSGLEVGIKVQTRGKMRNALESGGSKMRTVPTEEQSVRLEQVATEPMPQPEASRDDARGKSSGEADSG